MNKNSLFYPWLKENTWKFTKRMFKCLKRSFELIINIFVCRKRKSHVSDRKGMRIINTMISHFTLEITVKENGIFAVWGLSCYRINIFSKRDVWSVIMSFFSAVLEIYSIRQKLNFQKTLFHHGIILMKNINKTPKKIENVNDDGKK